jgi:TPR repeat protein
MASARSLALAAATAAVLSGYGVLEPGASAAAKASDSKPPSAELSAAIAACDAGAAVPLDPTAKAPPRQYWELMPENFDLAPVRVLQSQCQTAWVGAPDQARLQLQWLRVTMMIGEANLGLLAPQLRKLADSGSAEASFLLYQLHRSRPGADGSTLVTVSADEAMMALRAAAEEGHLAAIQEMIRLYRGSPEIKRDLREVVRWARRLESAPPQGIASTPFEAAARAAMPFLIASTTLEDDGFPATEARLAFRTAEGIMKEGGRDAIDAGRLVAHAMRHGRGTKKDPAAARALLETLAPKDADAAIQLAGMLMTDEGGPRDAKRAYAIVRAPNAKDSARARSIEAQILLAGDVVGYRPQEAIQALAKARAPEDLVRLAGLLLDYRPRLQDAGSIVDSMASYAASGRDDVALALARLKLSDLSDFGDVAGARVLLKPLADRGDRTALWLYASTQYSNLGDSSYQPVRQDGGFSDAELTALIDDGVARGESEAFLLKSKLLRAGVIYPQDDRAATDMLKQAAERDNVEALLRLGDAYDDGLGIGADKRKRLDAWRRAVALGSLKAKSKIARAFTFDSFDRMISLEEGLTWRIALYNDGYGRSFDGIIGGDSAAEMEFMGLFMGRAMEAGTDAVADAVMNAFREAPAGLEDKNLVALGKAFPPEVKIAIETRLAKAGLYAKSPDGYWGPEVRKALAAWVEKTGYVARVSAAEDDQSRPATVKKAAAAAASLDVATIDRIRTAVTREANEARTSRQKRAALEKVNLLAQYGDVPARLSLVPNYHQDATIRRVVSVAEITRYGLDLMITRPPGAEKVDFDVIFNVTQIYQDGGSAEFGKAVVDAVRDDSRLQDPLVLGSVLKQLIFAPGACEAVLASAQRAGADRLGSDGCDETTLSALVAFAKAKGPSGIDARSRKAAATVLGAM